MEKTYNPQQSEKEIYSLWEKGGYFSAQPDSPKKPYGLLMPPPNVTGALHLGHAMEHSIMDALARYKRLQGFDVLLLPGVDHAGIQFEGTLNRALEKEGLSKQKLGRDQWLKRAWQFKEESYNSVSTTWRLMGLSADWKREVFTLDEKVSRAVFEEFKTFYEQGLLYKGSYIVGWCPKDQTAIEDVEMEYEEKQEKLYFVRYAIDSEKNHIVVATTRPETIYADTGIAIYPNHPEFARFAGKMAINPLTGEKIPVFEDSRIDEKFGTGAVKMTPGHDPLDFQIGKDNNLPILHAVDKTGRMTDLAGEFSGIKATEAREKVAEKLETLGTLVKIEDYTHSVPVCERCKTTVEPLISEEWFVNMTPLAQKALTKIDEVNFTPKNYKNILSDWMKNIHDWCISRPLWWGYRIPVWYCQTCNPSQLVNKDAQGAAISQETPETECSKCKSKNWIQDEKLLDTWFSSGLWPLATLGWPHFAPDGASRGKPAVNKELERYYPWDFETSAGEIKYLWISRMIMLGVWFTNEIPFKNQFFHGMLRDLQGRKFSKSLGNGIDPIDLVEKWGTDATRMTLYTYSAPGRDGRASKQTIDERAKNFRNFANKLWNIGRYILDANKTANENSANVSETISINSDNFNSHSISTSHPDDKWILDELNKTIIEVTKNIEGFQLHLAAENIYEFTWHKFADIYLEKTKTRREEAQPTLFFILEKILIILHPFMPFITEKIYQEARAESRGSKSRRDKLFFPDVLMASLWPQEIK